MNKMRQALANINIPTNQSDTNSIPHDLPTPCFSDCTSIKSQSEYCSKCEPIVRELCSTLEKLLAMKDYASNLIAKKEEQLLSAFKLLEQAEKREVYLLNCLEERNKQFEEVREELEDTKKQTEEIKASEASNNKNNKVIEYLKAREYQLLTKIKGLELQLIHSESIFDNERLLNNLQPIESHRTGKIRQNQSIYSSRQNKFKTQANSLFYDSQARARIIGVKNKNDSLNLDAMETEAEIIMKDQLNPEIPLLLKQMQENMRILMRQQKILLERNQYLQKRMETEGKILH